jgi:hypothetical protein
VGSTKLHDIASQNIVKKKKERKKKRKEKSKAIPVTGHGGHRALRFS